MSHVAFAQLIARTQAAARTRDIAGIVLTMVVPTALMLTPLFFN